MYLYEKNYSYRNQKQIIEIDLAICIFFISLIMAIVFHIGIYLRACFAPYVANDLLEQLLCFPLGFLFCRFVLRTVLTNLCAKEGSLYETL